MSNDILGTVKELLGDNAEDKIKAVLEGLNTSSDGMESSENTSVSLPTDNINIDKIQNIVGSLTSANDSRSNLLMSLKPFMRNERQKSIDSAIKLLNLTGMMRYLK